MTDRGQTVYDFLLGMTLLLVTIILVLGLFGPLFGPFISPSGAENNEMADRIADRIVTENGTVFGERVLELDGNSFDDVDTLGERVGVPERKNVNVTLETSTGAIVEDSDNGDKISGGPERVTDPVAAADRVVKLPPGNDNCQEGCFLRVEVW